MRSNKGGVSLHPFRQSFPGLVFGSEDWGGLRASINFVTEDGRDEVRSLR
jgi:hypothetical protein